MPVQIGAPTISGIDLSVADALSQWSNQIQTERAQRNLQRARELGQQQTIEEKDGVPQLPEQKTALFGVIGRKSVEQYNKGLMDAYLLGVDRDNTEEIARIAQESNGRLDTFDEVSGKYRDTVLANIDQAARGQVQLSLDRLVARSRLQVQHQEISRQQQGSIDDRRNAFETYGQEAVRLMRNGDLEGAQENILKSRVAVDSMVLSGDISQAQADELFLNQEKGVFSQGHKREVLDIAENSIVDAHARVNELEKEIPKSFSPREWEAVVDDIRSDLIRMDSRAKGMARQSKKEARELFGMYKDSVELGFDVNAEQKTRVWDVVAGTDLEDDFQRVHKVQNFSLLPDADRRAIIETSQSNATTLEQQNDHKALIKAQDRLHKMAEKDGYSLGVRQGLIDEIPLDLNDPAILGERVKQASMLSDHYRVDVSPLTDNEAEAMADNLPNMTAADKTQLAQTLQPAPSVWEQIAGKKAGLFAMAGATGDKDVMGAIFKGEELLAAKQARNPTQKEYAVVADEYLGNAGEVYGTEDRRDVLQAALAHYAFTASDKQEFNDDEFESSLEAVTGGISEVNGFKLELPRGIDEDTFDDFIDEMQPETVESLGGLMFWQGDSAKKIQDAQIVSLGDGNYSVNINGMDQLNKSGELFTFKYTEELRLENELVLLQKRAKGRSPLGQQAIRESIERVEEELNAIRQP